MLRLSQPSDNCCEAAAILDHLITMKSPNWLVLPKAKTLPQYFADHGYRTQSLGKVFHIGHGNFGDPDSFQTEHFHDKVIEYLAEPFPDVYTCNEAYSDMQGWVQGSLRSANVMLKKFGIEPLPLATYEYIEGK